MAISGGTGSRGKAYELAIVNGKLKIFDPKPDQKVEIEDKRAQQLANLVEKPKRISWIFPSPSANNGNFRYGTGKQRLVRRAAPPLP